jgi:hypothetical protein
MSFGHSNDWAPLMEPTHTYKPTLVVRIYKPV